MKKMIRRISKKIVSVFMVVGMFFQVFFPITVMATTYQDGNSISIGGNPTINGSTFGYANGDVTITKNGSPINTTTFSVAQDDVIEITLAPDEHYNAQLHNNNDGSTATLVNNVYNFTIGNATSSTISLTPSFNIDEPPVSAIKYDFTINGESFTNVAVGDQVHVSNSFNMNTIEEFYITKIAIEGVRTYTYEPNEYSYNLRDNENLRIFETHFNKISDNSAIIRIEAHSNDILNDDIVQNKTIEDYFGFYITGISFIKEAFRGVEVSTSVMPDNYDFTIWNGADLKGTTKDKPGKVTAYYGENTISFSSVVTASSISEISLADNSSVPSSAVNINNTTGEITILSNYYNEIPLQIKLQDGTVGYITVNRIGIFIGDLNVGNKQFFHGAFANVGENLNVDTDKNRVVAVFYHEDTTTYEDYDLIVNITYDDGKTETTIAQGVGDVHNSSGNIIGSDYILWKGNNNTPKKISVTAVKKGAVSNKNTFGGATFGSGTGVEWERRGA